MLKTNSKKARENIRVYIMEHFDPSNYNVNQNPETFSETARIIWNTFQDEKYYSLEQIRERNLSMQSVFVDWCAGLPSILDTCYYYNRPAVADLGAILEETPDEINKYDESRACDLLTRLIYREIFQEVQK